MRTILSFFAAITLAKPVLAQTKVPLGDVLELSFENSKIFPGTYRDVWIYVPKQYVANRPLVCTSIRMASSSTRPDTIAERRK